MNIKEFCFRTGKTKQAVYKMIKKEKGYGQYFKRDSLGKWEVDPSRVDDVFIQGLISLERYIKRKGGSIDYMLGEIKNKRNIGVFFELIDGEYFIRTDDFIKYACTPMRDFTDDSKLFDCYWGAFRFSSLCDNLEDVEDIVKNRNDFIVSHKLKNRSRRWPKRYYRCLDHTESYTVQDSKDVLIISSPYDVWPEDGEINNWFKLPDMYARSANTFGFWYSENKHLFGRYNRKLEK